MKKKSLCGLFALTILILLSFSFNGVAYAEKVEYTAVRREAMDMDDSARVNGGGFVSQTDKARFGFKHSALWQADIRQYADYWFKGYQDWSEYEAAVITLYSNKNSGKSIYFRYMSDWNYNTCKMKVNWQGWASIIIPFNDSSRNRVSYIRLGANNASDGIYGQELSVASVRLVKKGEYSFMDNAFGYEVHDTAAAVLGQATAVYDGCPNALVNGEKRSIGKNGETAVKKDGKLMIPAEFAETLGKKKEYISETDIDGTAYVSFEEAAAEQGLTLAYSDGLAVAAKEGAGIFDGTNKKNPYSACAAYMLRSNTETLETVDSEYLSKIKDSIRQELLIKNAPNTVEAEKQLEFIKKNPDTPFGDLKFQNASDVAESYFRIEQLALAYAAENGKFYGDENVKNTIISSLEYMYENHYGKQQVNGTGNMYRGENDGVYLNVHIPYHLSNILILADKDISDENKKKYISPCLEMGISFADDEQLASISAAAVLGIGALSERADLLSYCRDKITERFLYADMERGQNKEPFLINESAMHTPLKERRIEELPSFVRSNISVLSGQGIMSDGSYISGGAHGENMSGGLSLLDLMNVSAALADTPFAVDFGTEFADILKNAYYPFVYNGMALRAVCGNENDGLSQKGLAVLSAMLNAERVIPETEYDELYAMIADMAEQYTDLELSQLNESRKKRLDEILAMKISASAETTNRVYSRMDRVLHKTDRFAAGISLSSNRIFDYNSSECKNTNGWYMGQGMTTVYVKGDRENFSDTYWAEVNPYKLPGTTVSTKERTAVSVRNGLEYKKGSSFAGGVSNGRYGVAAMTIEPYIVSNTPGSGAVGTKISEGRQADTEIKLSAKKSWFMLGDELVCLGSDITCSGDDMVITTVDNRIGDIITEEENITHISGNGECGYYFPNGAAVKTQKTENNFCELWIEHGTKPNGLQYSYAVLPSMTLEETREYAKNPKIKILANNRSVQAVSYNYGEICGYVFYGKQAFNGISVSEPVIIMQDRKENILYVSDPTQSLKQANITVRGELKVAAPELNSYKHINGATELSVNFEESCGRTIAIKLGK